LKTLRVISPRRGAGAIRILCWRTLRVWWLYSASGTEVPLTVRPHL